MPSLNDRMHLDMLRDFDGVGMYGLQWGDPDIEPKLRQVRYRWIDPFVNSVATALEIGPGGGRWTRYLLGFGTVYVVDYVAEMWAEFEKNFKHSMIVQIQNNGTDFPGVRDNSIDYIFSFGTFVHLDLDLIEQYLINMKRIVKREANIVIQYADKSKPAARRNINFSQNYPGRMRWMVSHAGYVIKGCEDKLLDNAAIIHFGLA